MLVIVVLVLFLFDWRSALISATAIPLSLMAAVMVFYWRGGTVNTMVLAGLVIALGEVVDDAIIDVENIVRRLRLNRRCRTAAQSLSGRLERVAGGPQRGRLCHADRDLRLPAGLLPGGPGRFLLSSAGDCRTFWPSSPRLVVALTVTPALSLLLLPRVAERRHRDGPLVALLKRIYRLVLPPLVRHKAVTLGGGVVVFGSLALLVPLLGEELMPKFKETDFLMHWVEKPGIGIDAMDRITIRASDELMAGRWRAQLRLAHRPCRGRR